jgi:hypothetical protein
LLTPVLTTTLPGAGNRGTGAASGDIDSPPRKRKSARISDGNHDGNDGSHQRPDAAVNSHVLSHIQPELGIRYLLGVTLLAPRQALAVTAASLSQNMHAAVAPRKGPNLPRGAGHGPC